jgi:hypothetical protein
MMNTTLNYTGLSLTITRNIDPDIVVKALKSLEYNKPGPKSRWTLADLQEMREMLEDNSYSEVAEHYGLKRGDNVYQILKRAGIIALQNYVDKFDEWAITSYGELEYRATHR